MMMKKMTCLIFHVDEGCSEKPRCHMRMSPRVLMTHNPLQISPLNQLLWISQVISPSCAIFSKNPMVKFPQWLDKSSSKYKLDTHPYKKMHSKRIPITRINQPPVPSISWSWIPIYAKYMCLNHQKIYH